MRQLWINGEWQAARVGGRRRRIQNPATLEIVDEVVEAGPDDVRRACATAVDAQRRWRTLPALER